MNPERILDIGANVGNWTAQALAIWPQAEYLLLEANPGCEPALQATGEKYMIVLLGEKTNDLVPFYSLDDTATGASVYRETATGLYEDVEPILLPQTTLDDLLPGDHYDLIKLDTQGSELDILKGGTRLVDSARWILCEVSTRTYNEGAPLLPEVVEYLKSIGFEWTSTVNSTPEIHQHDLLFERSADRGNAARTRRAQ